MVKLLLAGEMLFLAALIVSAKAGLISRYAFLESVAGLGFGVLARGIAIKLYLDVADEHRNARLPRLVWQAMAVNSALLLLRGVVSNDIVAALTADYYQSPLRGLFNHVFSVPASIFLLLGLLGMLQSYRNTGLGMRLKGRDYALIAVSLALFGSLLIFRKNLEEGQSSWTINKILQPVDLTLIAAASILSIVLHRYTTVMQGGRMAVVLRWLVFYGLLPGILVLLIQVVVPLIQQTMPFDATPLNRLWSLLPWLTTLAAATRAEMTADAVAQAARLKRTRESNEAVAPTFSEVDRVQSRTW
jgi:hypothetical protein